MLIEDVEGLRDWLISSLAPICTADHHALANCVVALLQADNSFQYQYKFRCEQSLSQYLFSRTKQFVDDLFKVLDSKAYITKKDVAVSETTVQHDVEDVHVPKDNDAVPSSSDQHLSTSKIDVREEKKALPVVEKSPMSESGKQSKVGRSSLSPHDTKLLADLYLIFPYHGPEKLRRYIGLFKERNKFSQINYDVMFQWCVERLLEDPVIDPPLPGTSLLDTGNDQLSVKQNTSGDDELSVTGFEPPKEVMITGMELAKDVQILADDLSINSYQTIATPGISDKNDQTKFSTVSSDDIDELKEQTGLTDKINTLNETNIGEYVPISSDKTTLPNTGFMNRVSTINVSRDDLYSATIMDSSESDESEDSLDSITHTDDDDELPDIPFPKKFEARSRNTYPNFMNAVSTTSIPAQTCSSSHSSNTSLRSNPFSHLSSQTSATPWQPSPFSSSVTSAASWRPPTFSSTASMARSAVSTESSSFKLSPAKFSHSQTLPNKPLFAAPFSQSTSGASFMPSNPISAVPSNPVISSTSSYPSITPMHLAQTVTIQSTHQITLNSHMHKKPQENDSTDDIQTKYLPPTPNITVQLHGQPVDPRQHQPLVDLEDTLSPGKNKSKRWHQPKYEKCEGCHAYYEYKVLERHQAKCEHLQTKPGTSRQRQQLAHSSRRQRNISHSMPRKSQHLEQSGLHVQSGLPQSVAHKSIPMTTGLNLDPTSTAANFMQHNENVLDLTKDHNENVPVDEIVTNHRTQQQKAEDEVTRIKNEVLEMFPDVDSNHLDLLCMTNTGPMALNNICAQLLDTNYPRTGLSATEPVSESQPVEKKCSVDYFTDCPQVEEKVKFLYDSQVFNKLMKDFIWIPANDIKYILSISEYYATAHRMLLQIWSFHSKVAKQASCSFRKALSKLECSCEFEDPKGRKITRSIQLLKNPRSAITLGTNLVPELKKEIEFVEQKLKEYAVEEDYKVACSVNEQEYEAEGQSIECGCCFAECPFENMVQCYEGHLFCVSCLSQYAREAIFGQGKADLKCMTDTCDSAFPKSQLQKALPPEVFDKYEDRVTEENINLADLDLVQCPHCDFRACLDPNARVFSCQNAECRKESCRYCRVDWTEHFGKKCSEVEKRDETKLRLEYEEKMTKAKVRVCHKCKAQFTKEDGCNKMTCRCGAKQCYICRKPNIDYKHFCGHPRDPGKLCTICTACSLWTNPDEDDDRAVSEIQKEAEEERKKKGFSCDTMVGVPEGPPVKKMKTH